MKRNLLSFILVAAAACSIGAQEEHPGGWDFNIPFINKSKSNNIRTDVVSVMTSFNIGWISGIGQPDGVNIDMGQSYEIELHNLICLDTRLGRNTWASIGMSLDWRNYRMTGRNMFQKQADGTVAVVPYPVGAEPKFSRLHTFSINMPLQLHVALGHHCYMSFGPEVYFNTYASLKTRYRLDGHKEKVKAKGLHRNVVTVGAGCDVSIYGIGVYCKYNPCHVLKEEFAPAFGSMTVGLRVKL